MSRCPLSISPSIGANVIPSDTRRQAACPLLQAAVDRRAPFLERPLELLGVLALKKTSEFRLQRRERRGLIGGERLARGGERCPYAQRCHRSDLAREIDGAVELFALRRHFLDKAQAIRLRGTPLNAGEHVAHGVAPATSRGKWTVAPPPGKTPR